MSNEEVVTYRVHSLVRRRVNRTLRARSPGKQRFRQFLFSGAEGGRTRRLVRNRYVVITQAELEAGLAELQAKAAHGILEVRTMDGRVLDLDTMKAGPARPAAPLPQRRPDSVEHDKPTGYALPIVEDGVPQGDPAAKRSADRLSEEKAAEAEAAAEPPTTEKPDKRRGRRSKKS